MDSPQLFLAFGAIMLVVALLGVAVDWFGKPLRHRRFVPKVYRFPDERQPRHSQVRQTEWSDASLVLPVVEPPNAQLVRYPDASVAGAVSAGTEPSSFTRDVGPPTAQVPVVDPVADFIDTEPEIVTLEELSTESDDDLEHLDHLVTMEDLEADESDDGVDDATNPADSDAEPVDADSGKNNRNGGGATRALGWQAGQFVFNLTADGTEPSPATVRTRYWKNVASTAGANMFGVSNLDRMTTGKAPRRLNHRTGKSESMRLPTLGYEDAAGETPLPEWPTSEVDPFA